MDLEVFSKSVFRRFDEGRVCSGDGEVVDVGKQDGGENSVFLAKEYSMIMFRSGEADISEDLPENLIPSLSTLFESVECLQEL